MATVVALITRVLPTKAFVVGMPKKKRKEEILRRFGFMFNSKPLKTT